MKEEALKLADYVDAREINNPHLKEASAMIRRLVEELDMQTQPKSLLVNVVENHIEDLLKCVEIFKSHRMLGTAREMKEAIKEFVDAINTTLQTKPLSDEEILEYSDVFSLDKSPLYEFTDKGLVLFTRAILERHGIK